MEAGEEIKENENVLPEPQNRDPEIFGAVYETVIGVLQLYGWVIFFVVVAVLYIGSKVKPWLGQQLQQSQSNSYKKMDVGYVQDRLEAMEKARLRMQAQHDEEARKFAERQKLKEEEKQRQRFENWEKQQPGSSKPVKRASEAVQKPGAVKSQPKKPMRPEYNPLMGGDSGACYRPSRRGGPSSGG